MPEKVDLETHDLTKVLYTHTVQTMKATNANTSEADEFYSEDFSSGAERLLSYLT